jgi:hypothetical protein
MSDASSNLFAALLGAIVGGLLTLAGSVLVNRWELRRRARFRIYEELLPRVRESWERLKWHGEQPELFEQSLDALQRASTVLGPREWLAAYQAWLNAQVYVGVSMSEPDPPLIIDDERDEGVQPLEDIEEQIENDMDRLDEMIGTQIKGTWGPWWWRRWFARRRRKAVGMAEPDEPE